MYTYFYLLFGCPTPKFGSLSMKSPTHATLIPTPNPLDYSPRSQTFERYLKNILKLFVPVKIVKLNRKYQITAIMLSLNIHIYFGKLNLRNPRETWKSGSVDF